MYSHSAKNSRRLRSNAEPLPQKLGDRGIGNFIRTSFSRGNATSF